MPNLRDIQRRIVSIKKTQQITRAMRMVAGAKLRRAQDASDRAAPYADRMRATLLEVAQGVSDDAHPLFETRDSVKKVELIVVSSDRGLCGGFNSGVNKFAESVVKQRESEVAEITVKKNRAAMKNFMSVVGSRMHVADIETEHFDEFRKARYQRAVQQYERKGWYI